jgi:hypothetical protein
MRLGLQRGDAENAEGNAEKKEKTERSRVDGL